METVFEGLEGLRVYIGDVVIWVTHKPNTMSI